MADREITQDEAEAMQDDPDVVGVADDELPTDIADEFVEVLARIGVDVEVLVPPAGFPSVFYRIGRSPGDAARLRALIDEMAESCRTVRDALVKQIASGGDRYDEAAAWQAANLLQGVIAKAEAEMTP